MRIPEKDRIDFLVALLEDGNGAAFARKIGCDKARITDIRKGRRGISAYRDRILEAYPNMVSWEFIETGDVGYFPAFALISYLMRENARLSGKQEEE